MLASTLAETLRLARLETIEECAAFVETFTYRGGSKSGRLQIAEALRALAKAGDPS